MFGQPRSTFGATTTTFGTGFGTPSTTATTTGFGGSTFGRFGTPQQQTTSFGTGGAAPFGAATSSSTSLFGTQPQQSSGGLFGQPQTQTTTGFTSGFGTTTGGGLFGQTQQPATGLFGSGTGTGFGTQQSTQNRPFGFGQTTTSTTTTGGLFGTTPSTGGGLFGTSTGFGATGGAAVSGTTVKYEPVTGSDTMNRNGVSTNIRTRIEVITAMKEYESKSMEELRVEDYLANRKGPGQGGAMGGFGQTQQQQQTPAAGGGLFSSTAGTSLFGTKAPENKSLFGTTASTGFGTSSGGSLFGSSNVTPAFGQPSSTASTGFSFGQTQQQQQPQQAKSTGFNFGGTATTTPSLFGTTSQQPQQPSFSMQGFQLGQNTQQQNTGGLFGTQNKPGTSGFLSTPNTGGGLFGKPAGITQPLGTGFGTTSAVTPFGTTNTSTGVGAGGGGLFGAQNQNKGTTGLFSPFNTGTNMGTFGTPGIFGQNNNQQKPGGTLPFSSFGTSNLSTGFGTNPGGGFLNTSLPTSNTMGLGATGTNTGFGMAQPNILGGGVGGSVFPDLGKLVKAMTEKPILDLPVDAKANAAKGSPSSSDQVGSKLSNSNLKPTYVLSPSLVTSTKPKPKPINKNNNQNNNRHWLFKGLEDPNEETAEEFLKPKKYPSVRTLNLKVFRGAKTDTNTPSTPIEGRGRVNGEVEGKVSQVGEGAVSPSPLTTPLSTVTDSTPLPLVTSTLAGRTHDNSPTPDIIKGRPIKHLNLSDKLSGGHQFDDTLADLNVRGPLHHHHHHHHQDSEADKENNNNSGSNNTANISLFNVSNVTEDDEEEVANLSGLVTEEIVHPAGIKLQRPGYYTLPPMDELAQMVVTEPPNDTTVTPNKRCPVENFTVGRYGYGNVCFLGVTDVAGLDLDSTVFIVRKQVEVYPPGTTKPPRGRKLNRPAIVTLDCVWPVDKTTREVIKSEERLQAMGWTEYLERQCLKMEASFLEYRPETGSWVFKVQHFSKYGLQDDDDDDDMMTAANNNNKQQQLQQQQQHTDTQGHPPTTTTTTTTAFLPLSLANKPSGPPATALTSPPQLPLPHITSTTTTTAVVPPLTLSQPTRFLESALQDTQSPEDDFLDTIAREPEESAALSILSPSAERLTVVSRVVPRTIQLAKMQMFGGRDEEEEEQDVAMMIGREIQPLVTSTATTRESTPASAYCKVNKRRMLSGDVVMSHTSSPLQGEGRPRLNQTGPSIRPSSPKPVTIQEEGPKLHDPHTEYQLLPSGLTETHEIEHIPPQHQSTILPFKSSLLYGLQRCICDMGAFMGRSFRVGWGPGFTLAHVGSVLGSNEMMEEDGKDVSSSPQPSFLFYGSLSTQPKLSKGVEGPRYKVLMEKLHPTHPDTESIADLVQDSLTCILDHSILEGVEEMQDLTQPSSACPFFRPLRDIDLLHQLADTAILHPEYPTLGEILTLCVALWGRLDFYNPESNGESEYTGSRSRVEAVSQWVESVSEESVVREVTLALSPEANGEGYLEAILAHLTARQVSQACILAQEKGDHHLALLLAQTCMGQSVPRQIMTEQLLNWGEAGTDNLMHPARLTLYTLLSGKATHLTSSNALLNATIGLDWRRALGLHLWYVCPATCTLGEALDEYDKAAGLDRDKTPPYCNPPLPPYLANHALRDNMKVSYDMCYHLLKLFTDPRHPLEALLNPATALPDPINVTISWLMCQVLESLNYHHLSAYHSASLHLSMAALLESTGYWHWAVFILLHLIDDDRREREVRQLLLRHVRVGREDLSRGAEEAYASQETFVVDRLRLPRRWIDAAKAIRARSLGMVDEEAWYLLKSGDLNRAHTLIIDTIAPASIINEDEDYLLGYLNQLKEGDRHKQVAGWGTGGGVYSDYLEVNAVVKDMTTSKKPTPALLEQLRPRLLTLCSRLNNLKCNTALHRLCVSEMSKKVVGVLRAVVGEGTDATQGLSQQLSNLPLTHDYALAELNLVTNHYLTHLASDT